MLTFLLGILIGAVVAVSAIAVSAGNGDSETPRKVYRHWKGGTYEVIYECVLLADDLEPMVVYRALYGQHNIYVRTRSTFFGKTTNYQGNTVNRFERIK